MHGVGKILTYHKIKKKTKPHVWGSKLRFFIELRYFQPVETYLKKKYQQTEPHAWDWKNINIPYKKKTKPHAWGSIMTFFIEFNISTD